MPLIPPDMPVPPDAPGLIVVPVESVEGIDVPGSAGIVDPLPPAAPVAPWSIAPWSIAPEPEVLPMPVEPGAPGGVGLAEGSVGGAGVPGIVGSVFIIPVPVPVEGEAVSWAMA